MSEDKHYFEDRGVQKVKITKRHERNVGVIKPAE